MLHIAEVARQKTTRPIAGTADDDAAYLSGREANDDAAYCHGGAAEDDAVAACQTMTPRNAMAA